MYELQSRKLPRVFVLAPGFAPSALGFLRPETPARAAVQSDERGQLVESSTHPKTTVTLLMIRRDRAFERSTFLLHDSCRPDITIPRARGLI